jgi:hypothetical protein
MGGMDVLVALARELAGALLITFAYGLPALVAVHRRHDRAEAIAQLDLLLGWTVLGWLVLLAWALEWTPRRSRLWRRLARGRDGGTRWTAPRSGGDPAGLAPADAPGMLPRPWQLRRATSRARPKLPSGDRLAAPAAGFRRRRGSG